MKVAASCFPIIPNPTRLNALFVSQFLKPQDISNKFKSINGILGNITYTIVFRGIWFSLIYYTPNSNTSR